MTGGREEQRVAADAARTALDRLSANRGVTIVPHILPRAQAAPAVQAAVQAPAQAAPAQAAPAVQAPAQAAPAVQAPAPAVQDPRYLVFPRDQLLVTPPENGGLPPLVRANAMRTRPPRFQFPDPE